MLEITKWTKKNHSICPNIPERERERVIKWANVTYNGEGMGFSFVQNVGLSHYGPKNKRYISPYSHIYDYDYANLLKIKGKYNV